MTATVPQRAKDEASFILSSSPPPIERAMTLAPPTPKRLEMAERNINAGIHTVTAVSIAELLVRPTKKVSAILYTTRMIWPITVGNASSNIARVIGLFLKSSSSRLFPICVSLLL